MPDQGYQSSEVLLTGDMFDSEQFLLRHRAPSYVLPCPVMTAVNDVASTRKLVVKENFARLADLAS